MLPLNLYLKTLPLLTVALVLSVHALSQIQQPSRFEKEQKFNDEDFTVITLKSDGVALIREKKEFKGGKQTWEVMLLDTILQETGTVEFEIDHENRFIGFEQSPGVVYFLFAKSNLRGSMSLISVDIKAKDVHQYEIKPELNLQLTQFWKAGENFVFGGSVNNESAVLLYNPGTDNLKVLPGFFQKNVELIDMRVNQNQTFNTILVDRGDHEKKKIIFRTYDFSGKQILEDLTDIEEDIVLLTSMSSSLEREDLIVMGTWGKSNSKQASGFYTLPVNPFTDQEIKRIYFGTLQHYLDYLKPKKAAKIKLKSLSAIEAGKIPDFADHVMPFKIVEYEKGFLLLAESYTSSGNSNQYPANFPYSGSPYYSPYGGYYPANRVYSPYPVSYGNNVQHTEEVKTIESVVLAFDGNGTVLWDYSLPLTGIKRQSLEQICDFTLTGNNIHFLYKNESELKIKTINLEDQEVVEKTEKIQLSHPADEVRSESEQVGSIKHWFGKNFYVWGYQSIRNKENADNKIKQVFYINKVVVH